MSKFKLKPVVNYSNINAVTLLRPLRVKSVGTIFLLRQSHVALSDNRLEANACTWRYGVVNVLMFNVL